jgi:hypothetical protein
MLKCCHIVPTFALLNIHFVTYLISLSLLLRQVEISLSLLLNYVQCFRPSVLADADTLSVFSSLGSGIHAPLEGT